MSQVFANKENFGALTKFSNTVVQLAPSVITIGAKQYTTGILDCDTGISGIGGLDTGVAQNWKTYYVYAVVSASNAILITSLSSINPLGYTSFTLVGNFKTDGSAQVGIGVGVTETGKIGDKKDSMLTEAQFQVEHGSGWILSDGRDITGSGYHSITGLTTVPDARGLSIRGKNNGRSDGKENPDGDVALGLYQADKMQGHQHNLPARVSTAGGGGFPQADQINSGMTNFPTGAPVTEGANGTPRYGVETTSKNITMNMFIKIN